MFKHGFPPEWSTLKKLIWLVGSGIAGAASGIWKTVTGTLIHITDAFASPMQKCEVSLEPIQDLHGQDAPYPAGGGKNLLNPQHFANRGYGSGGDIYTVDNDMIKVNSSDGMAWANITGFTLKAGTYTFTAFPQNSVSAGGAIRYNDSNHYTSGGKYTFTLNADTEVKIKADAGSGVTYPYYIKFQIESGSTSTDFAPYENICPITGWTGCEVWRTGTNVFDGHWELGALNTNTGAESPSNNDIRTGFIPVKGAREYHISWETQSLYMLFCTYHADKSFSRYFGARSANAHTWIVINDDEAYFRFYTYGNKVEPTNMHIEPDSAASSYEAPNIATASVTFPDTVYGGKYEFVSGEGEDEFANIIVNGDVNISIPYATYIGENASRCYVNFETITGKKRQTSPAVDKCNMLKYSPYFADLERVESVYGRDGTSLVMIKLPNSITGIESTDSTSIAIAKFKAYFGSNPLQYTYKVAESAEFPLTPQEISTLKGVNNVWSNTNGNTTVIYKAQAE